MGKKWIWFSLLIIAVGGLAAVNVLNMGSTKAVTTASAERGVLSESVYANGRLQPAAEHTVYTEVSGKVAEVHVREGDRVQAGDALLTYDTEEWELQLEEERNQAAIARLQREVDRKRSFELVRGQTDAEEADKVRADEESAQRLYELQLASTERNMALLQERIRERTVVSPTDGVVTAVAVQEGAAVPAGYESVRLADVSRLVVEAALNELDAGKVEAGMDAVVTGDAFEEQFGGKLTYMAPIAQPVGADGYDYEVPIKVEVAGDAAELGKLKPGFAATLEFQLSGAEQVLVPLRAVGYSGQDAYVYTIADGAAVRTAVTVGKDDGEWIEILSGLQAGDPIIHPIPDGLREGDPVKVETVE